MAHFKEYICLNCKHSIHAKKNILKKPRQCSICSSSTIVEFDFYSNLLKQASHNQSNPFLFLLAIENVVQQNISYQAKLSLINEFLSEVKKKL